MTNKERMSAFEMRLSGMTWGEVAAALHYSKATVERDIKSCILGRKRKSICIYPALKEVLVRDYGGSIQRLADAVGLPYSSAYCCLTGITSPAYKTGRKICAFLGLTPEQAFGKKELSP